MIIVLVHWLIKSGHRHEEAFEQMWKRMKIDPSSGLYRELLTEVVLDEDPKFNTFSLTDKAYKTYINVGIWKDLKSFDEAVGKYIQAPETRQPLTGSMAGRDMQAIYMHDLEFKIRERVILKKLFDRKGSLELPEADTA